MFAVEFFKTKAKNIPVLEWLRKLPREDKAVIGQVLRTVQIGFPIGMPVCRPLKDGLFEVRSSLPSKREARLIFFQTEESLVIVEGFIKKTKTTPAAAIELSKKRKSEYLTAKYP